MTGATTTLAVALAAGVVISDVCVRLRIPAILPLMAAGIVLGPFGMGVVDGGELGASLDAFIAAAVGLLVFEGAMHLDRDTLAHAPRAVWGLLTVGVLITWALVALAAVVLVGLPPETAVLVGAILTVTGPTVVLPILRRVRLSARLHSVLTAEAILIDPIGVVLTVTTLEIVVGRAHPTFAGTGLLGLYGVPLAAGVLAGGIAGVLGVAVLRAAGRYEPVPSEHGAGVCLVVCMGSLALGDLLVSESGLVGTAAAGLIVARAGIRGLRSIRRSMEHLSSVLVGVIFVLLASRFDLMRFAEVGWRDAAFVGVVLLVVRPVAVLVSTVRSSLTWRERAFAALTAPRGIVAVSVAAVVVAELARADTAQAQELKEFGVRVGMLVLLVVLVSVTASGLLSGVLARALGVRAGPPGGVLIIGGHLLARQLGAALRATGVPVRLVDTNPKNVERARALDLDIATGDATDLGWLDDEVVTRDTGWVVAATDNDDVDRVVARWGAARFGAGRAMVWGRSSQMGPPAPAAAGRTTEVVAPVFGPVRPLREVLTDLNAGRLVVERWTGPREDGTPLAAVKDGSAMLLTAGGGSGPEGSIVIGISGVGEKAVEATVATVESMA